MITGEKALEIMGRVSYERELPFALGDEIKKRDCRDQIIQFMELDDKQLLEMGEKGWKSMYGKGLRKRYTEPERTKWYNIYMEEGEYRIER